LRRVQARSDRSNATLPKDDGKGCHGRGARDKRRKMNDAGRAARTGLCYTPDNDKRGGCQDAGQVGHGGLKAGLAKGTGESIRFGRVVVKQGAEEQESDYGNGNQSPDLDPVPPAPVWMREFHRTLECEALAVSANARPNFRN